jgi:hemerythrin
VNGQKQLRQKEEETMPGTALDFVQNPLYIPLHDKGLPFLYDQSACGSPATGRALTQRAKARPISNLATHLQAKVYAGLTGSLRRPVRQRSMEVRMFNTLFGSESEKVSGKNLPRTPFAVWTNRMSVEVKLLDNDHKKLAILISELHEGVVAGWAKQALERVFEGLVRHLRIHFAHEEQLFAETAYPDAAIHLREHDNLIERVMELQARFVSETGVDSSLEVVNLLKGWLFSHIQSSDLEYVSHFKAKSVEAMLAARETLMGIAPRKKASGPRIMQGVWSA